MTGVQKKKRKTNEKSADLRTVCNIFYVHDLNIEAFKKQLR